ncbi:MAG: DegT/DnrJ/EryC1/StrS family aminotransferase, partial [Candidatus Gerdarchaeota archaeon]
MEWKIPLFKTYNDEEDIKAVSKIITRGTYWASGKEINEFETKLAEFNERKFALTFNSGTTAW